MLTIRVVFFSLFPLIFFGLPLSRILFPGEPISERWVKVPFLGLAFVTLVTQNLIYINVPVKESALWIWGLGLILWIVYLFLEFRKRFPGLRFHPSKDSLLIIIILLIVYVVQGFGIFGSSAKYYVGRAWYDQYNYTALAQFLSDYPFSTSLAQVADQPYAQVAISLKSDRIGQSAYHAFVLTSADTDAKSTFEVVILLYPLLVAIAIFWIVRSFVSSRFAWLAMLWSGTLPSLTLVHLESFLSQALGVPFLLILPLFFEGVRGKHSIRAILAAGIILAAGVSIYTEFLYLYLFELFLVILAWGVYQLSLSISIDRVSHGIKLVVPDRHKLKDGIQLLGNSTLLIFSSILANVGFWDGILQISRRVSAPGLLLGHYPWAYSLEGIARLWFGDWSVLSPTIAILFDISGIALMLVAYSGLTLIWIRHKQNINFTILVLCVLPLGLPMLGPGYQYQFYKLLLTVSPLYVIGLVFFVEEPRFSALINRIFRLENGLTSSKVLMGAIILLLLSGGSALSMAYRSGFGKTFDEIGRGNAYLLNAPETRSIQNFLESTQNKTILISYWHDAANGIYLNGWLAYFARNNKVFVTNPAITRIIVPSPDALGLDISKLPAGSLIVNSSAPPCNGEFAGEDSTSILKNKLFQVHAISGNHWAFIDQILNPNGIEADSSGNPFIWIGNDAASIIVYSGRAGTLDFQPRLYPGPSLPDTFVRTLEIDNLGSKIEVAVSGEPREQPIEIPVQIGRNEIKFHVLEKPTQQVIGDSRTLLVNVSNFCQFELNGN